MWITRFPFIPLLGSHVYDDQVRDHDDLARGKGDGDVDADDDGQVRDEGDVEPLCEQQEAQQQLPCNPLLISANESFAIPLPVALLISFLVFILCDNSRNPCHPIFISAFF